MEKDEIRKILGDKDNKILRLEKDLERMKKSLRNESYGLAWIEVPEAFEDDVENKLPIVTPVPKLDIKNKTGITHLLIEAENYHALTCLNYTHKGKIDVIYIDPPYNTGSDGFRYKDKRILDKYPDGAEVPIDHPLRHSYWLSFMRKRLELAKELLSEKGIIYISIDDNEHAQLRMLCDSIFDEGNFVGTATWEKRTKAQNTETAREMFQSKTEYILVYKNDPNRVRFNLEVAGEKVYDLEDKGGLYRLKKIEEMSALGIRGRETMVFPIEGVSPRRGFQWKIGKEQVEKHKTKGDLVLIEGRPYIKIRPQNETNQKFLPFWSHFFDKDTYGTSEKGKTELTQILGTNEHEFETVKPVNLIKKLLFHINNKNAIVLDFFAGSGTTGHAVLEMNSQDDGNRQFILCTNDEELESNGEKNKHQICSDICYPRLNKVINGYKNKKGEKINGLGGSVKYYRIGFAGENSILNANDKDKIALAHNATELLAIAENTLESVIKNSHFEIFKNTDRYTAIYFKESFDKFNDFVKKVFTLKKPTVVYIFSWENDPFVDEFEDSSNITVKTIPEPILEIYRRIHNL